MSKRCWAVKVTWDGQADCQVKQITVRPGDDLEDTPEAVMEFVQARCHHRRGTKYFYPKTVEIDYEVDSTCLPKPVTDTNRPPQPLMAPPKKLKKE